MASKYPKVSLSLIWVVVLVILALVALYVGKTLTTPMNGPATKVLNTTPSAQDDIPTLEADLKDLEKDTTTSDLEELETLTQ